MGPSSQQDILYSALRCTLEHPSVLRDESLLNGTAPRGKDAKPVGVEANGRVLRVFAKRHTKCLLPSKKCLSLTG